MNYNLYKISKGSRIYYIGNLSYPLTGITKDQKEATLISRDEKPSVQAMNDQGWMWVDVR